MFACCLDLFCHPCPSSCRALVCPHHNFCFTIHSVLPKTPQTSLLCMVHASQRKQHPCVSIHFIACCPNEYAMTVLEQKFRSIGDCTLFFVFGKGAKFQAMLSMNVMRFPQKVTSTVTCKVQNCVERATTVFTTLPTTPFTSGLFDFTCCRAADT